MKNYKGNMLLIELVIVILFFSLSQVVLVQVFAEANKRTLHTTRVNQALVTSGDLVEQLASSGDAEETLRQAGFSGENGSYTFSQNGVDFVATIRRLSEPQGQLVTVELSAKQADQLLFTLPSVQYIATGVQHE